MACDQSSGLVENKLMPASDFPTAAISVIPAVVSPIIAWALGRSTVGKQSARIDYLNKRLDFRERLNKLHGQLTDETLKELIQTEIQHYRAFLRQTPSFIVAIEQSEVTSSESWLSRFFLVAPAKSKRQRIFKGVFYGIEHGVRFGGDHNPGRKDRRAFNGT